jgi:hypothetical protein
MGPQSPRLDTSIAPSWREVKLMWNPAEALTNLVQELVLTHSQMPPNALLYAEKPGGFQCATCRYAHRIEVDGQGTCQVMTGPIDLVAGCCVLWDADPNQLQAVEEGA